MTESTLTGRTKSEAKRRTLRNHVPSLPFVVAAAVVLALAVGAFVYSGIYNVAADQPHTPAVYGLLNTLRDRSIAVHARGISPPADFDTPARVRVGAGLYAEMCSGCHLGPGVERSEISQGLYPQAPELAKARRSYDPAEAFWTIKHGVKLTAMPAWGRTHSDELIWDMVAFVKTLPRLTPATYQAAVKSAPADHDAIMHDMPAMKKGG